MRQGLSRAERWKTCLHEAGHAVMFALAGTPVYRLAVAPEGALDWPYRSLRGRPCRDLWGVCEKSDLVLPRSFLRWVASEGELHADGRSFAALLATEIGRAQLESLPPQVVRQIHGHVLGLLAGPAAEAIGQAGCRGRRPVERLLADPGEDLRRARALAALLAEPDPLEAAAALTLDTLARDEVRGRIVALAQALAEQGDLHSGLDAWLPAPWTDWP